MHTIYRIDMNNKYTHKLVTFLGQISVTCTLLHKTHIANDAYHRHETKTHKQLVIFGVNVQEAICGSADLE